MNYLELTSAIEALQERVARMESKIRKLEEALKNNGVVLG